MMMMMMMMMMMRMLMLVVDGDRGGYDFWFVFPSLSWKIRQKLLLWKWPSPFKRADSPFLCQIEIEIDIDRETER